MMRRYFTAIIIGAALLSFALVSCESGSGLPGIGGGDARSILDRFCRLKQSTIAQVLLTPPQIAAGRVVCQAIGEGMGNPG
jgi:hypothetical protein